MTLLRNLCWKILLHVELTDEQVIRCVQSAAADALSWKTEADGDFLPDVASMHCDWHIDADLRDAGVTDEGMQRLSFAIATCASITHATTETLAAL